MADADEATDVQGVIPEPLVYSKKLRLRPGEADAMLVEMAQWDRIRRRVKQLEERWSINWLAAGASTSGSLAVSSAIAALVLPSGANTGISSTVAPALWALTAVLVALTVGFVYLARLARMERMKVGPDIVDEMNTIEEAWKERKAERREIL